MLTSSNKRKLKTGLVPEGRRARTVAAKDDEIVASFEEMDLKIGLLKGIEAYGFHRPSAIQQKAIMPIIRGRNVIALGHSGSGKTSMIALTVCQLVNTSRKVVQALILSARKKQAELTRKMVLAMGSDLNIKARACTGDRSVRSDSNKLKYGLHVVAGTPARVLKLIETGALLPKTVKLLVLEWSDVILSNVFKDQIDHVYGYLPSEVQVVLISATFPTEASEMITKLIGNPKRIYLKRDELTFQDLEQYYVEVTEENDKIDAIWHLSKTIIRGQVLFCCTNTETVDLLTGKLKKTGVSVLKLGDNKTPQDKVCIERVSYGRFEFLVTTDEQIKAHDFKQFDVVCNYDFPRDPKLYVRRISHVGHYGREGVAISLVKLGDKQFLKEVEQKYKIKIGLMSL